MYALFEGARQVGNPFPNEVWEAALIDGLVIDVPVAEESDLEKIVSTTLTPNISSPLQTLPD